MINTKVVAINPIYVLVVDKFLIWCYLESQIFLNFTYLEFEIYVLFFL